MNRKSAFAAPALGVIITLISAIPPRLYGQSPPTTETSASNQDQEEVVRLSPFVVSATEDQSTYRATSTLAGTRVRTDLNDIASSISVITSQFMQDTAVTDNQSLLVYTTNTEVAGLSGNYGGVGNIYLNGASEPNLVTPNANTRVRGLDSADNTRDYFPTDIPWDSFDVGRIDLQRGPNSILFGIGSPAGIINASVNTAEYRDAYKLENRVGSFGTVRDSIDLNQVLLKDELTLRLAALDDDTQYRQKPTYNHDRRLFGAVRWDPKLFNTASAHTTIRANFEHGDVTANRPHELPPTDMITPFFNAFNKTTYDPYYVWEAGIVPTATAAPGPQANYWLGQGIPGAHNQQNMMFFFNGNSSAPIVASGGGPGGSGANSYFGIGPSGAIDSNIGGFVFAPPISIQGYSAYAIMHNRGFPNDPSTMGAASGFYKDRSLTDPSIFDFYNNLLVGPNQKQWQGWDAFDIVLEQTFFNNRLGFQFVYDHQKYHDGQEGIFGNYINVDVNTNTYQSPWPYSTSVTSYNGTGTAGNSANAGRAYVAGDGQGSSNASSRGNIRATVTGELRATDFLRKSWLSDALGRHVFTGLYSKETYDNETRSWDLYALDPSWADVAGSGPSEGGSNGLLAQNRTIDMLAYLSGPLFGAPSASGVHIQPISANISPSGSANVQHYDSHWKWSLDPSASNYVNPAAPWMNPATGAASTQSENPANYIGWTSGNFRILNADQGDINSLYTAGSKIQKITESKGLTWQGFLWEDTLALTVGWRRDTQKQRSGYAPISNVTGAASMNYDLNPLDPATGTSSDDSRSWGVVLHTPKAFGNKLPFGTNISLTYDDGRNVRVQNRYGFDGSPLPNAKGRTKDYGIVINTLNDRLQFKVTWYKTTVTDANLSSVLSSESTLGANAYYLYYLPPWALGDALQGLAGMAGDSTANGSSYLWNWAQYDHPGDPAYLNVSTPQFQNDPETLKEKAAISSFLGQLGQFFPQSWWNAYGIPVNVASSMAGDYKNAVTGWNVSQGNWLIRAAGNGTINGVAPVGTVDNESKGVEIEITGQPLKNWNVSINASKQHASEIALGQSLSAFINKMETFYSSPAGDIRLWWGGDQSIRDYFNQNIWSAYQFQQGTTGKLVPEMAPWRFNLVTNYSFDRGFLRGVNVGGALRWQQGAILGYALNSTRDNLDVNKPYWGKSTYAVDLWVGYQRKLSRRLDWRIQLNLRGVDSRAHLEPVSVEPDGTPALQRIVEGQTWTLTNTFAF